MSETLIYILIFAAIMFLMHRGHGHGKGGCGGHSHNQHKEHTHRNNDSTSDRGLDDKKEHVHNHH